MTTVAIARDSRRPTLALAFGLYAALMGWITALVVVPTLALLPVLEPTMTATDWAIVLGALGLGSLAGPVLYGVVGMGLHRGSRWARTAATALAFLSLNNLPFGVLLGVGTLWTLHGQREEVTA